MKITGQLLIALVGGIVAIILYRSFENNGSDTFIGNTPTGIFGRNTAFTPGAVDSINNVFNVGFGDAAETTLAQVVHIRARIVARMQGDPFYQHFGDGFWGPRYRSHPQPQVQEASGSGVIVSSEGYIVTNNHVVGQASDIIVSLYNGRGYKAEIVGTDPSTDLAVIKIDEENLPPAVLANSDDGS